MTQKKNLSLPKKMDSSNAQAEISKNEVKEDSDGVEIDSTKGTEGQRSEVIIDADILENGIDEDALDTDSNILSKETEKEEAQPSPDTKTGAEVTRGKRKLQIQGKWRGVDPVLFYRDDTVIDRIMEFYGIKESFPFKGHLITRNIDNNHVKRIYYISKYVKDVLELNLLAGQHLKIASAGLKMFVSYLYIESFTGFKISVFFLFFNLEW